MRSDSLRLRGRRAAGAILTIAALLTAGDALAQSKLERTAAFRDWAVFVDANAPQKLCWAATVPVETKSSRDGITRGDAFLSVSSLQGKNVKGEISVILGYPADNNKAITLDVDGKKFAMFSEGEEAWLESPDQDAQVLEAMRRGSKAEVTATSTRGTVVTDVYSLMGFTNSVGRVGELCQ